MKARITFLTLAMGVLIALFQNCSQVEFASKVDELSVVDLGEIPIDPQDPDITPNYLTGLLQYIQPDTVITKRVDILFVIDTSSSLDAERGEIADNIGEFVDELPADVDYNIGVLLAHGSGSTWSGKLYKPAMQTDFVLKSENLAFGESYSTILRGRLTETPGQSATDGGEAGMAAVHSLLSPSNLAVAQTQGLFRTDAALAVVFVSDENDVCANYPANVAPVPDPQGSETKFKNEHCANITAENTYAKLVNLKKNLPLLVAGIIYTDPLSTPAGGENEVGYGYTDMIGLNNGLAVSIGGDIAQGLSAIGSLVTRHLQLQTRFTLSHEHLTSCVNQLPKEAIIVKVDNFTYQNFIYNPDGCEVQLSANQAGQARSVVKIEFTFLYEEGDSAPLAFGAKTSVAANATGR